MDKGLLTVLNENSAVRFIVEKDDEYVHVYYKPNDTQLLEEMENPEDLFKSSDLLCDQYMLFTSIAQAKYLVGVDAHSDIDPVEFIVDTFEDGRYMNDTSDAQYKYIIIE